MRDGMATGYDTSEQALGAKAERGPSAGLRPD